MRWGRALRHAGPGPLLGAVLCAWLLAAGVISVPIAAPQVVSGGQAPSPNAGGAGAPQQKGTGFILGQVVDASSGRPIPDAIVTMAVRAVAAAAPAGGRGGAPVTPPRVITDGEGHFLFHDLLKGNYPLSATATGYVNGNSGQLRPNGPSRPIELGDGERLTGVKLRMWKYAVVSGTVLDESGEPAVGVSVRVLRRTIARGRPRYQPGAASKTDDRGMYRISTIVPGDFLIAVPQTLVTMPVATMNAFIKSLTSGVSSGGAMGDIISSGGSMGSGNGVRVGDMLVSNTSSVPPTVQGGRVLAYPTLFFPSVVAAAQATQVSLASGEDRSGVDFQLRTVPAVRVTGTLSGPSGPIPNVTVRLLAAGSEDLAESGFDVASTSTTAEGTFTFLGVPAGQYMVKAFKAARPVIPAELASSPLMQLAFGAPGSGGNAPAQPLFAEAPVGVGSSDVTGLSLMLTEGAKLSGHLEFEGSAVKPNAQQLRALSISATEADAHIAQAKGSGRVDQDGRFTVTGLSSGRYTLDLVGGLPGGWTLKSVAADGRDVTLGSIEVKDADMSDVVVTFTDTRPQVSGTVRISSDASPSFVSVMLFPADFRAWVDAGMNTRGTRTATATKAGSYTLAGLVPGDYFIAALDDADVAGRDQDLAFFDALSRVATRITVALGDKRTEDLSIVKVGR